MKAIHNSPLKTNLSHGNAFDSSKIQKWKQFTTSYCVAYKSKWMLLIVQRYKNESNSQRCLVATMIFTNAFDSSKIQKWKQFTTHIHGDIVPDGMLLIVQRYKNESNSQLAADKESLHA